MWRTDRSGEMRENPEMKKSYGTPLVTSIGGRNVLLSPASTGGPKAAALLYSGKSFCDAGYDILKTILYVGCEALSTVPGISLE